MNRADIRKLLQEVKNNDIEVEAALAMIEDLPYKELGFAKIQHASIKLVVLSGLQFQDCS